MYSKKQRYILRTALQLFRVYGLRSVTMDEIAQAAGVSKKTIYQFFHDKNEMVDALYEKITNVLDHRLKKIQQSTGGDVIQRYIQINALAMGAANYVSNKVLSDLKKYYSDTYENFQIFSNKKFVPAITQCIEEGKSSGHFLPIFNSKLMTMVCLSELNFSNETHPTQMPQISEASINKQLIQHFLYGITTSTGKAQAEKYFSKTQF